MGKKHGHSRNNSFPICDPVSGLWNIDSRLNRQRLEVSVVMVLLWNNFDRLLKRWHYVLF